MIGYLKSCSFGGFDKSMAFVAVAESLASSSGASGSCC